MGNTLVVATLPDEVFMARGLVEPVWNDEIGNMQYVRVRDQYDQDAWNRLHRNRAEMLRRHPQAVWRVPVSYSDVWYPPSEGDISAARERNRYAPAVRRSLETFLDPKLRRIVKDVHVAVKMPTGRP